LQHALVGGLSGTIFRLGARGGTGGVDGIQHVGYAGGVVLRQRIRSCTRAISGAVGQLAVVAVGPLGSAVASRNLGPANTASLSTAPRQCQSRQFLHERQGIVSRARLRRIDGWPRTVGIT
jgi:hypothetical protein